MQKFCTNIVKKTNNVRDLAQIRQPKVLAIGEKSLPIVWRPTKPVKSNLGQITFTVWQYFKPAAAGTKFRSFVRRKTVQDFSGTKRQYVGVSHLQLGEILPERQTGFDPTCPKNITNGQKSDCEHPYLTIHALVELNCLVFKTKYEAKVPSNVRRNH